MYQEFKIGEQYRTGKDAVDDWLALWGGKRGTGFTLPAPYQRFTVVEIDNTRTELIVFEAECLVCGAPFRQARTQKQVEIRPKFQRTCSEHRGQSRNAPHGMWTQGKVLAMRVLAKEKPGRSVGVVEGDVLQALADLDVVGDVLLASAVAKRAAAYAPRGKGRTDQRRKVAKRALRSLVRRGVVEAARIEW